MLDKPAEHGFGLFAGGTAFTARWSRSSQRPIFRVKLKWLSEIAKRDMVGAIRFELAPDN